MMDMNEEKFGVVIKESSYYHEDKLGVKQGPYKTEQDAQVACDEYWDWFKEYEKEYEMFLKMFKMQLSFQENQFPDTWREYPYYRAIWMECAELCDKYGWKWWAKNDDSKTPKGDIFLEVVDIWHFGMCSLLVDDTPEKLAYYMMSTLSERDKIYNTKWSTETIIEVTEGIAITAITDMKLSISGFLNLLEVTSISLEDLTKYYIGKHELNKLRQKHGYREGIYEKHWLIEGGTMEDNEVLRTLLETNTWSEFFADTIELVLENAYFDSKKRGQKANA